MICSRCILDDTVPELELDERQICNYCYLHDILEKQYPGGKKATVALKKLVKEIKKNGEGKRYDCIVGVSGGTDSSYVLYQAVKCGLRPLAVHFDNGWNSEIAVSNIKKICTKLNVDLYTYVVDWEEFKNLQVSFLKASVPDAEIPTDVGLHGVLMRVANKENIKYVFNGYSFRAEGMAPVGWTYMDGKYIDSVHNKFGDIKLKTYPNFLLKHFFYFNLIKGIKVIPFLNYFNYVKERAKKILTKELDWQYYGGHHHESVYTRFFQSYYLPVKFNIDKRKTELSAMVRCGHIARQRALKEIFNNPYKCDQEIIDYVISKLGLTKKDFEAILKNKKKTFKDYSTYYPMLKRFKLPVKIAYQIGIIPKLLYLKFYTLLF